MYNVGDAHNALLKLEAEMCRSGINVLEDEYVETRINHGKVVMKLLDYSTQVNDSNTIYPPKLEASACGQETLVCRPLRRDR